MTFARIQDGLKWISAEFAVTPEEANKHLGPMLREGLVSKGYARTARDGAISVTEAGFRAMREAPDAD